MGLLRDAVSSATGPSNVKNGFNGPQIPFLSDRNQQGRRADSMRPSRDGSSPPPNSGPQGFPSIMHPHSRHSMYRAQQSDYDSRVRGAQYTDYLFPVNSVDYPVPHDQYTADANKTLQPYIALNGKREYDCRLSDREESHYDDMNAERQFCQQNHSRYTTFRPLALPVVAYGDGQPFLRGYSHELQRYNISRSEFISTIDAINTAVIPNPELQIFQKGANIAGWFLPGAESIGLMGGQIVAGVGGAFFHKATVNKILAKANLDVFVPQGLEICIGSSKDIDNEVGLQQSSIQFRQLPSPEGRLGVYGALLAPLDEILPVLQNQGRRDPIAMIGRGIGKQNDEKKARRAQKAVSRGREEKINKMEGDLKWLIVRQASEQAVNAWQKVLQQSNAELADTQTPQKHRA